MADTLGSRAGIDLVVTRNGQLKIGVNEWPDGTQAASEPGLIPDGSQRRQGQLAIHRGDVRLPRPRRST